MTSEQIDPTVDAQGTVTTAVLDPERSYPDLPAPAIDDQTRQGRVVRTMSAAIKRKSRALTVARRSVLAIQGTAGRVTSLLPGTIRATRAGAHEATSALQTLSDPMLRSLAASSVGVGVGFYLAGAPRLAIAAGVVPALIMGTAIAVRPMVPLVPTEAAR